MKRLIVTLIVVTSQLALFGGLFLAWEQIRTRPLLVLLGSVFYELIVLVFAFGGKVWAKIEAVAVQSTADWVLSAASRFAPGFLRRYKKYIVNDYGVFNVLGLGLINTYKLPLSQVFVELRINPSNPQKFNESLIADRNLSGNRPIWDFLRSKELTKSDATALSLIGPPGSGKTTLLQHIAITFASNRQYRHQIRAHIPVLLFLRNHVSVIAGEKSPSLSRLVQDYFGDKDLFATLKTPGGWFDKQLEKGKCIVLLDGLDEVADLQQRKIISAWVDNQIKNYPRSRFVITSRPQGYRSAPLQRAHVLEVQPFNADQVHRFVKNWYLANEIIEDGTQSIKVARRKAHKQANDLLQLLRTLSSIRALTVNPLLLTMITMVHHYHHALPESRVELYAEIFEVLLERWRQSRGVEDNLTAEKKLAALMPLAAYMMEERLTEISAETATKIIGKLLKQVGLEEINTKRFLTDVQAGSGIILEREEGRWGFAHLTFQEYLTAADWLSQKSKYRKWDALVGDSWWNETLRWYACQGNATPVVKACLKDSSAAALALIINCLDEAHELDSEAREDARTYLIDALESADVDRRHSAAEVYLSRRLESLHPLMDEQFEIDIGYLTCAEYQLFLDELSARGEYRQPDHWTAPLFKRGEALKPICGIRAEDASAFCIWLTQKKGGGVRYRLPRPEEVKQYKSKTDELATWCYDGEKFGLEGLAETNGQTIVDQLMSLSSLPPPQLNVFDIDLNTAVSHSFAIARPLMITRGINLGIDLARFVARSIIRDPNLDVAFTRHVTSDELTTTQSMAYHLAMTPVYSRAHSFYTASPNEYVMVGRQSLLEIIKAASAARSASQIRQTQRRYIARILEYAYQGYKRVKRFDFNPPPQRKSQYRKANNQLNPEPAFLKLYWWLEIVLARETSDLPAWEGIRIVCEQTKGRKSP
ncbi:MAG TPA: NACHT domain-containing protein [Pyrinomonadaceae bacterium]|jgi:hypothetical protein